MSNIEKLSNELSKLTILEAAELVKCLETKWGVQASNIIQQQSGSQGEGKKEPIEKKEFDVILKSAGEKKIQVIKIVREIAALGLKEAKNLVDSAPTSIKTKILEKDALVIKERLEKHGAIIEIK